MNRVIWGENLKVLQGLAVGSVDLVYVDPPFNTGRIQTGTQHRGTEDVSYQDRSNHDDFVDHIVARMIRARDLLKDTGAAYVHLDYREVHYVKVALDQVFSRDNFLNEVIWAYDYGGRSKTRWSAKHDTLLFYSKDREKFKFNYEEMDRIPYMAPGLVGPEKAARGKTPTDCWLDSDVQWQTIVPTQGKERTGYPTQKPLGLLKRLIRSASREGDLVLDFFAGSGTTGEACQQLGRSFVMIDESRDAYEIMKTRLGSDGVTYQELSAS